MNLWYCGCKIVDIVFYTEDLQTDRLPYVCM